MVPVIRISDSTWERLKGRAIPLEDTPDDVIRKLLDLDDRHQETLQSPTPSTTKVPSIGGPTTKRLPKGIRLPIGEYLNPVLEALYELGGRARVNEVLNVVEGKLRPILPAIDYEPLPSGGDIRWRNRAQWARKRLITDGLLKADAERGFWELSARGIQAVDAEKIKINPA